MTYILLFSLLSFALASGQLSAGGFDEIFSNLPSWEAYSAMLHGHDYPQSPSLGLEYANKLKLLFRFANLKGSPVEDILDEGGIPLDLESYNDLTLDNVINLIENDIKFRWKFFRELKGKQQFVEEYLDFQTSDLRDRLPWLDTNFDDPDYAECYKDYSSLAEPVTNRILEIVGRRILTDLFADYEDQEEFCDTACQAICDLLGNPTGCLLGCDTICMGSTYNRTSIVEALLDFFIPDVEPQSWGRKMVDYMAKIPSGLSDGQLMWTAAYFVCSDLEDSYNYTNVTSGEWEIRNVQGRHCRLPFKPQPFVNRSLSLFVGICVPDSCTKQHIWRYIYEDNIVLSILLNNILNWEVDHEKIFCEYGMELSEDPGMQTCLAIIIILILIAVIATLYDVYVRPNLIAKKLQAVGITEETQAQQNIRQAFDNQAYTGLNEINGDCPPGYHHVDESDYHTYMTLVPERKKQDGDNTNNNNSAPVLQHSISTNSTRPLVSQSSYDGSVAVKEKPSFWNRLEVAFVRFSAYTNMKAIFQINRPEGYIACIDFMRFVSFCWVVFGHTWLFGPLYNESWCAGNLISSLQFYPRQFAFQGAVINFHLAGDTFFVISGLLTVYNWLGKYDKGKEELTWKGVLYFYLHRYWKLMPALMLVLMFYTTAIYYVSSGGPLSPNEVGDAEGCQTNWWTNLLLMHNLVNTDEMCLSWTWYVACVFQLHLVAPLILIPLIVFPIAGYAMLGVFYIVHISATAAVSSDIYDSGEIGRWFTDYLVTPWCRAGPYLIGMALGIFLHETKLKIKISELVKLICGLLALFFLIAPAYATYSRFKEDADDWTKAETVMWNTFSRSTWALGVCWFILICSTGNGGYLGDWLNHTMHQPLARMVYPSFLFHSLMIFGHVYSQQVVIFITWMKMVHMGLSNLLIILFTGVIFIGLLFYYPIAIGLDKALTVKTKRDCIMAGNHPTFLDEPSQSHYNQEPSSPITPTGFGSQPAYPGSTAKKQSLSAPLPGTPKMGTYKSTTKF